ncbi:hypothetical protein MHYP_G00226150 [Metynnis hypsauchen]
MQLFSFWVLTVLTSVLSGQQTLAIIKTTWRDLNDPATLYCPEPCSGMETWERSGLKVTECGVKEESEFSCERRLDQSNLTVPHINYTTRGFYHTKSHSSSVEVPAGDPLILDLFTFHPVTLTFSWTDGGSVTPCPDVHCGWTLRAL